MLKRGDDCIVVEGVMGSDEEDPLWSFFTSKSATEHFFNESVPVLHV